LDYRLPARDRAILKSLQYRLSGQHEKLIAFLRMQVSLKDDASSHSMLAKILMVTGELEEAKRQFLAALDKDALNLGIYLQLSLLERAMGNMESAIGFARKYQEEKPEDFEAQQVLGDLLRDSGNLDAAEEHYLQAAVLADQSVQPLLRLVDIAMRKGDVNDARDLLEQAEMAAQSVAHKAQVRGAVSELEFRLGRIRAGIEQLYLQEEFLVQFQPPFAIALATYMPMVRAHNSLGDPDSAQEVLDIALGMVAPPMDKFFAFGEADILIERGDYDGAEAAVQSGAEIIEQFKIADMNFLVEMMDGFIQRERGDYPASSAAFQASLERINHSVIGGSGLYRELCQLNAELAQSLVLGGDLDQAEKALAEGFRLDPSEPLLWVNKARFQFASGLPQLAHASVNYALAIWKDADPEYRALNKAQSLEQEIRRSLSE
jgi:tetratricopeptide (TPR) repeat protein